MNSIAPIILFAYNRPEHTRKTLQSLKANFLADQSTLYIYVDGARESDSVEQRNKIALVKEVIREEKWCKEVYISESETNKGLAASVTNGVSDIVNKFGKVIVLEDDHVSDKWFLKFMNDALAIYEAEDQVACISGYIYPVKDKLSTTFFIKGADCWGWATWKRAWDTLNVNGEELLKELESRKLTSDFNFSDTYPYIQMLKDQIEKKNNSWAILWYASAYLKDMYTLYPGHSLIQNIGIDGSGTHSGETNKFDVTLFQEQITVTKHKIEEDKVAKNVIADYFKSVKQSKPTSLLSRVIKKIKG